MRLSPQVYAELDSRLRPVDAELRRRYPGDPGGRQPVHTVYVPADRLTADLPGQWGGAALAALPACAVPDGLRDRVAGKLTREPIEDLRVDFEDGYGGHGDAEEDAAARAAARALPDRPFIGIRIKSLAEATRRRAIRTLDAFLGALGPVPDGFVITIPKVSAAEQVTAAAVLCGHLEQEYGLAPGRLRFELQVETAPAVLAADGTATVARMVHAAEGRCTGLHFGTYDYTAACGVAGAYQSLDHPAADHAATYGFFRDGLAVARDRLLAYLDRQTGAVLDEPATARALAGFLLRGLDCGAVDAGETGVDRSILEDLRAGRREQEPW